MAWKGTPAEKRAWAIKKSKERQAKAAEKDRQLVSGYEVSPRDHPCDVPDLEYDIFPEALSSARCTVCGRTWVRERNGGGFPVLKVTPLTLKKPSSP